jgi:hypothetical protein
MIKFFRNIRKNLLSEGKTINYFKYAIGEIVLVVIGILIALQINNWNETQKLIKQEQQILLELREELSINVKHFENVIKTNTEIIDKTKRFLDEPKKNIVPPDSISIISDLFDYSPYLIEQSILNTILNSSDEKIIECKFLLEDLRSLKNNYNYVAQSLFYLDTFWNSNSAKYLITSGLGSSMGNSYNYVEPLIIDKEFYSLLIMQKTLVNGFIKVVERAKKRSIEIMDKIEKLSIHD